ncbi:unnamed protein product [Rotaria sp. Silwood2]|nr:unnamed protein product [Rotaria sp. Silwood2]CAF2671585.1 unnamed protein product [Rotaria sp. Silwood2]CAF3890188.1 unnamed protein product [Rotaria sp. Silwood2]CAF3898132.1 unnamed protein product [Rotaria sp. Silwood2]
MSSIVRRNSNKSSDIDEHDEEDNEQHEHFRQTRERRLSAPDIRRRTVPVDRISSESDQKATLSEQINSSKLTTQTGSSILTRKHYRSGGELYLFNSFI